MLAAVFKKRGVLGIEDRPEPGQPAEEEVLLEVEGCADPYRNFSRRRSWNSHRRWVRKWRRRPISLVVDTEVVERLSAPAENELQNVVKLFQRKVVRPGEEGNSIRARFVTPGYFSTCGLLKLH